MPSSSRTRGSYPILLILVMSEMRERISPGRNSPRARGFDRDAKLLCDDAREVSHTGGTSAADVHRQPIQFIASGGKQIRVGDIFDEAQIARLVAIFIHDGWLTIQQARAKDGDNSGVGVEEGLSWAVGAGVPQGHGGNAGLFAP